MNLAVRFAGSYLLLCLALAPAIGTADARRCGNRLVTRGDHLLRVEKICGAPDQTEKSEGYRLGLVYDPWLRGALPVQELLSVEIWTYNLGPQRFMRQLRFENGVLTRIRDLDYGF